MKEILSKRTLTSKSFDLGNKKTQHEFNSGHIHYDNEGALENIDLTLVPTATGFEMKKAGYGFEVDSVLAAKSPYKFIKDGKSFGMIPRGLRWNNEVVVYQDVAEKTVTSVSKQARFVGAFGSHDLIFAPYNTGLRKLVKLNSLPKVPEGVTHLEIGFEIVGADEVWFQDPANQPAVDAIREQLKTKDAERLVLEKNKKYTEARAIGEEQKQLEIDLHDAMVSRWDGTDTKFMGEWQLRQGGMAIYGRQVMVWENKQSGIPIEAEFRMRNDKMYFVKLVPVEFLKKATFPVFTDAVTDFLTTAGGNGRVFRNGDSESWATVHDDTTGTSASTGGGFAAVSCRSSFSGGNYFIHRSFAPCDTSAIDDGDVIDGATYSTFAFIIEDTDSASFHAVQTSQVSVTALEVADYDAVTFVSGGSKTLASSSTSQYNVITLNATGEGWITKTGVTKIGHITSLDLSDSAPTGNNNYNCNGTDRPDSEHMKLTITTSAAAAGLVPNIIIF